MNESDPQMEKIVAAQLNVCLRRLSEGKPLTAAQMEMARATLARRAASRVPPDSQGDGDVIAANASELSRLLGVSRQLIAHHRGRSGSPTTLSLEAWRDYLAIHAKGAVRDQLAPRPRQEAGLTFGDGVGALLARIGKHLRDIVKAACADAGVKLSPAKLDEITFGVFLRFAAVADKLVETHGFESVFTPPEAEEGEPAPHWEPVEITAVANRIAARRKPKKTE